MDLFEKYKQANQEHVFQYFSTLTPAEQSALSAQLSSVDPQALNTIVDKALKWKPDQSNIEPLPQISSVIGNTERQIDEWRQAGLNAIKNNKVAVLLLAGGQGTRLGSSNPKGQFDIGLPSHKSLFQLQAERIAKLNPEICWYIMTSGPTREPTERFFKENNFFNLKNVFFFEQGTIPCVDFNGKILMESRGKIAVSPDGNGGVYQALENGGVLKDMQARKIEHVHMYCVDNSLVKVADPVFIGFSILKRAEVATKVVRKRSPDEQVGVIAMRSGHPAVIEYSEINNELRVAVDENNLLKFRAANIVNHYYSVNFLLKSVQLARENMPFHIAKKKIPYFDGKQTVKPETPNGIKLEQFVFDIFSSVDLENFATLEVPRESEFSPVKNAPGSAEDSPDTAKRDLMLEGKNWLLNVGAKVSGGVEVAPSVSYNGEGLEGYAGKEVGEYLH